MADQQTCEKLSAEYGHFLYLLSCVDKEINFKDLESLRHLREDLENTYKFLESVLFPFEKELQLRKQYNSQVKVLTRAGILKTLSSEEKGIIGENGKEYVLPEYTKLRKNLSRQSKELLSKNIKDGFTKLLLVPFGMSLGEILTVLNKRMKKHYQEGNLFVCWKTAGGDIRKPADKLSEGTPVDMILHFEHSSLKTIITYYPKKFVKKDPSHHTKDFLLKTELYEGWVPLLVNSKAISRGYLNQAEQLQNLHGEYFFSLEDEFTYLLTRLEEDKEIEVLAGPIISAGTYLSDADRVALTNWWKDSCYAVHAVKPAEVDNRSLLRTAIRII